MLPFMIGLIQVGKGLLMFLDPLEMLNSWHMRDLKLRDFNNIPDAKPRLL